MAATNEATAAIDEMTNRQTVYALMARLFRTEVDGPLLVELRDGAFLSSDEPALAEALQMMHAYFDKEGACVLDLARDYAKLFCGAGSTKRSSARTRPARLRARPPGQLAS